VNEFRRQDDRIRSRAGTADAVSTTETDPATSAIPQPRAPEQLAPWAPDVPTQRGARPGIRWIDDPPPTTDTPPAGLTGAPPDGRRRRWVLVVVILAVVLVVAGVIAVVGVVTTTHRTMAVAGSLVVAGRGALVPGASCSVSTVPGHTVTIFDGDGRVLGSTPLPGSGTALDQWQTASPWADACRFSFTVGGVAADEDSYRVGLDGNPADTVSFSHDELTTTGAQLTYGH
jgi:hypothetical protein